MGLVGWGEDWGLVGWLVQTWLLGGGGLKRVGEGGLFSPLTPCMYYICRI